MARYQLITKFCEETGYTPAAVRAKIRDGIWMEGREWRKAPDGHVLIDVEGYESWVEQGITTGFGPVGETNRCSPPPSNILKAFSEGFAALQRASRSVFVGILASPTEVYLHRYLHTGGFQPLFNVWNG